MQVGEVCTRVPVTCPRHTKMSEVALLMREHHVGAVIVVDQPAGGRPRPVSIVTDRDLVVEVMARGVAPESVLADDLLLGGLHVVNECESVFAAAWQMRGRGVRRLPVVADDGTLVGMLTADDVGRVLAETVLDISRVAPHQMG